MDDPLFFSIILQHNFSALFFSIIFQHYSSAHYKTKHVLMHYTIPVDQKSYKFFPFQKIHIPKHATYYKNLIQLISSKDSYSSGTCYKNSIQLSSCKDHNPMELTRIFIQFFSFKRFIFLEYAVKSYCFSQLVLKPDLLFEHLSSLTGWATQSGSPNLFPLDPIGRLFPNCPLLGYHRKPN